MLSKKYSSTFLKIDKNKDLKSIMDEILNKEQQFNISFMEWNHEQLEQFLKDLHSLSPNTISRAKAFLQSFANYIAEKEQIESPQFKLDFGKLYDLVDFDRLLPTILSYEQYRHIKNQLDNNIRDKVIFELAWLLLSSDEIKNLKESDVIIEIDPNTEMEYALLKISDTKTVRVYDPEVVEDLKMCKRERCYYVRAIDGKDKTMKLRLAPLSKEDYLIKPVDVGRSKKDEYFISNPTIALQKAIQQQNITCPGFDVSQISIESVRRSKLIYMLAPQNEKFFDKYIIMNELDSGNVESNLSWLKKVSIRKYDN